MRKIKVGIVAPTPPPHGGVTRVIENNLSHWGSEIESFLFPIHVPDHPDPPSGTNYVDLYNQFTPHWKGFAHYVRLFSQSPLTKPRNILKYLNYNLRLSRFIKDNQLDILYSHHLWPEGASAILQGKIHGIKTFVVTYGETWHTTTQHVRQKRVESYVFSNASWVSASSEHCLQGAINSGADQSKSSVIYAGIDMDRFHPKVDGTGFRTQYQIDKNTVVISALGLALKRKLDLLLESLQYISSIHPVEILIGGVGDDYDYIKNKTQNLNAINVKILGFVKEDVLPAFYAATDILVVSPNSLLECMGQSMKEAMAVGKPVVGSNIGGVPEAISNGINGLLFNHESPKELAAALNKLIDDKQLRENLGEEGRKVATSKFSHKKSADETLQTFKKIIGHDNK